MPTTKGSLRMDIALHGAIFCVVVISIFSRSAYVDARAVNISNTWILPEEGFPVFYRYFRDRISWYEADAVCQFHHANLVTVDTTAQYDAARAYLKELDIMSSVWIGLIKSNEEGDFTWTDYKALSGEGYWASAPEGGRTPLCTALDPARDYRWGALSCGGPQVASFICELPVPVWALKPAGGCLVRSIPSLTVQFLPELAAVQLISDCGLDGTKKVTCKANESHSDILKELSCAISEEDFSDNAVTGISSVEASSGSPRTSPPGGWSWNPSTPSAGDSSTRTRRETVAPSTPLPITSTTPKPGIQPTNTAYTTPQQTEVSRPATKPKILTPTALLSTQASTVKQSTTQLKALDESSVSENPKKATVTTIPAETSTPIVITTPKTVPLVTEKEAITTTTSQVVQVIPKQREHHDNIYTQATDHFIPPLVMAKSKLSADMTVVSSETKHQQFLMAHHLHQLHKTTQHTETTNVQTVTNKVSINKPTEPTTTSAPNVVTETNITETTSAKAADTKVPTTVIANINFNMNTPATSDDLVSRITPPHLETDVTNQDKTKYRKPTKGKKYDKIKEEKKKSKDMTIESTPSTELTHKVESVSSTELTRKVESAPTTELTYKVESTSTTELTHKVESTPTTESIHKVESTLSTELTHKVVAITIPKMAGTNAPAVVLEITTKLQEEPAKIQLSTSNNIVPISTAPSRTQSPPTSQPKVEQKKILIDPNIMILNKNGNINNESETILHPLTQIPVLNDITNQTTPKQNDNVPEVKKTLIMVNHSSDANPEVIGTGKDVNGSEEMVEQSLDPLPRPNRSRTLTQTPQHRSFYPYFFNRVLG